MELTWFSFSLVAEIDQVVAEAKFKIRSNLNCSSPQPGTALSKSRPGEGREKAVLRLYEVFGLRESPSIYKAFCFGKGLFVERGNSAGEGVDEVIQFVVRKSAIDPAVLCRRLSIEVVASEDNFQCPGSPHEEGESLKRTASRKRAGTDLWLPEHSVLSAGES